MGKKSVEKSRKRLKIEESEDSSSPESEESVSESHTDSSTASEASISEQESPPRKRPTKKRPKKRDISSDSSNQSASSVEVTKKHKHKSRKRKKSKKRRHRQSESESESDASVIEVKEKRKKKHKRKHKKHSKHRSRDSSAESLPDQRDIIAVTKNVELGIKLKVSDKEAKSKWDSPAQQAAELYRPSRDKYIKSTEKDTVRVPSTNAQDFYRGSSKDKSLRSVESLPTSYRRQNIKDEKKSRAPDERERNVYQDNKEVYYRSDVREDSRNHRSSKATTDHRERDRDYQTDHRSEQLPDDRGYAKDNYHQNRDNHNNRDYYKKPAYNQNHHENNPRDRDNFRDNYPREPRAPPVHRNEDYNSEHRESRTRNYSENYNRPDNYRNWDNKANANYSHAQDNRNWNQNDRAGNYNRRDIKQERVEASQDRQSRKRKSRSPHVRRSSRSHSRTKAPNNSRNDKAPPKDTHKRKSRSRSESRSAAPTRNTRPARSRSDRPQDSKKDSDYNWGKQDSKGVEKSSKAPPADKEKPNFGLSGKLAEDTNTFNGIVIKYSEPQEARKPKRRWRFYPFKGETVMPTLYIHRQSCYLIGRDRMVVDIPIDHPSCSKQHAALQYRLVSFKRENGSTGKRVRPYIIDLESSNGTYVNNNRIDAKKYVELLERDVVKFGFSSREYVLLHENSKEETQDDDINEETAEAVVKKEEPEG